MAGVNKEPMEVSSGDGGCDGGPGGSCTYNPQNLQPGIYSQLPPGVITRTDFDSYYRAVPTYGGSGGSRGRNTSDAPSQLVIRAYVSDLTKVVGKDTRTRDNRVGLHIRRRNKVVTLQYEAFSGQLAANGIRYISLGTSTTSKPITPVEEPIICEYNGTRMVGYIRIDSCDVDEIQLHFDIKDSIDVKVGDTVSFSGRTVHWITDSE